MAIACQGGGSHTAFTAGVLSRLFDGPELDRLDGYEVVGLSGTSGGAVCALMAWTALRDGDRRKARALLDGFWGDNSASTPLDAAVNVWLLWASTLQSAGFLPTVSPYDLPSTGLDHFRDLLDAPGRLRPDRGRRRSARSPLLLIGAVDVLSGQFRAFNSRRERIVAGHDPRLRGDPDPLPDGARRRTAPSGTACSPRTRRCTTCSTRGPTSSG